jgi:hypothetical protein
LINLRVGNAAIVRLHTDHLRELIDCLVLWHQLTVSIKLDDDNIAAILDALDTSVFPKLCEDSIDESISPLTHILAINWSGLINLDHSRTVNITAVEPPQF